jgi:hypothetical protein
MSGWVMRMIRTIRRSASSWFQKYWVSGALWL